MQVIISKSTIVAAVRKGEQIDLVDKMLFRAAETFNKMGMPKLDDAIWSNFVNKTVKSISNCTLQKAINVLVSSDALVIDISDEFIIDTMDIGGEMLITVMKLISQLQSHRSDDAKTYKEKWITKICPLVENQKEEKTC